MCNCYISSGIYVHNCFARGEVEGERDLLTIAYNHIIGLQGAHEAPTMFQIIITINNYEIILECLLYLKCYAAPEIGCKMFHRKAFFDEHCT